MSNERSKIEDIRREVRMAYDSDFWHTWPENIQAFYRDLNTLLEYIDALEAAARAVCDAHIMSEYTPELSALREAVGDG